MRSPALAWILSDDYSATMEIELTSYASYESSIELTQSAQDELQSIEEELYEEAYYECESWSGYTNHDCDLFAQDSVDYGEVDLKIWNITSMLTNPYWFYYENWPYDIQHAP